MMISRKRVVAIIIFILVVIGVTINGIEDSLRIVGSNKNLSHQFLVHTYVSSGQKLMFNWTAYLTIILLAFPCRYKNVFILTRVKNLNAVHNRTILKNIILTTITLITVIIVQVLITNIYNVPFEISVMLNSLINIAICSYSAFSLNALLYQLKINNYISIAIFIILRFVLLIVTLEFSFISNSNNVDLIIKAYIMIELIITNYVSIFVYSNKKDVAL